MMRYYELFWVFFDLSAAERKGGVVIISIILISLLWRCLFSGEEKVTTLNAAHKKQFAEFVASVRTESEKLHSPKEKKNHSPFYPDSLKISDWQKLGFSQRQAETILSFKKAIGGFHSREDLLQCFVIDSSDLSLWGDALLFEEAVIAQKNKAARSSSEFQSQGENAPEYDFFKPQKITIPYLELNSTDSVELIKLPGIGPLTAGRIIRFRNSLGGFYSTDQLQEVWGIREENLLMALEYLSVDTTLLIQQCINTADEKALADHPYIRPGIARTIINYREQHGSFNTLEELKSCVVVTDSIYGKIEAYFTSCKRTGEKD